MGCTFSKQAQLAASNKERVHSSTDDISYRLGQSMEDRFDGSKARYRTCSILAAEGIACAIWLEDLLGWYGCNTQVWDLNLLVRDPAEAASALSKLSYQQIPHDDNFDHVSLIYERGIRVSRSSTPTEGCGVVLLAATDWYYDAESLDELHELQDFLPPLHQFIDSLAKIWLNIPVDEYGSQLLRFALYIGCLTYYCYRLVDGNDQKVSTNAYADRLKLEHRELHYDIVAPYDKRAEFTTGYLHRYHIKKYKQIKDGKFLPTPHKAHSFRPDLTPPPESDLSSFPLFLASYQGIKLEAAFPPLSWRKLALLSYIHPLSPKRGSHE